MAQRAAHLHHNLAQYNALFIVHIALLTTTRWRFSNSFDGWAKIENENGLFQVTLKIDAEIKSTGTGKNKREAEYQACVYAIKMLELDW